MGRAPTFPRLAAGGRGAGLELMQTVAFLSLPAGVSAVVVAGGFYPAGYIWVPLAAGVLAVGLTAYLWGAWRYARGHEGEDRGHYSSTHFLVRYMGGWLLGVLLLIFLCGGAGLGGKGVWAFVLALVGGACYPWVRILRRTDAVGGEELTRRRLLWAAILLLLFVESIVCAVTIFVAGVIAQAHAPYPTDPTFLLLTVWLIGALGVVAGVTLTASYVGRLYGVAPKDQALDEGGEEVGGGYFRSERF